MKKKIENIKELAHQLNQLTSVARSQFEKEVNHIIDNKISDDGIIQHTLDSMLSFCFDKEILVFYKSLCRHYFYLNAAATVDYINLYRELWDSESLEDE